MSSSTNSKLPPLKPLSSFRNLNNNNNANLSSSINSNNSSSLHQKSKILFIPPWILDELSRIYSVLLRRRNENQSMKSTTNSSSSSAVQAKFDQQHQFISKSLFPILLCGIKDTNMTQVDGYNPSLFDCQVVGGCLSGIQSQQQQLKQNSKTQPFDLETCFLRSLFPQEFSILKKISSFSDLEEIFSSKNNNLIVKPLPESWILKQQKNVLSKKKVVVYVPFYEKKTRSDESELISVQIISSSKDCNKKSFEIPRSEYDSETFTQQHVLPRIQDFVNSDNSDLIVVTPTKINLEDAFQSFELDEDSSFEEKKTRQQQQLPTHQGVDFFYYYNSNSKNNMITSSNKYQLQLSMQYLQSREASLAKWDVFDLSSSSSSFLEGQWSPILAPIYPESFRTFIHRVLLLPPCPYLVPSTSLLCSTSLVGRDLIFGKKDKEEPKQNPRLSTTTSSLFYSKMCHNLPKNTHRSLYAFVRSSFGIFTSSQNWDSTYLSIFTILSWFVNQKGFLSSSNGLSSLISNEARTFFSSAEIEEKIHKIQKILTKCDETKSGKLAESFYKTKSEIGAVEALLAFRYLLLHDSSFDEDEDEEKTAPFFLQTNIHNNNNNNNNNKNLQSSSSTMMKSEMEQQQQEDPFEFRMVRFQFSTKELLILQHEEDDDASTLSLHHHLFPPAYIRMIINHFDKSASPILMEIEPERSTSKRENKQRKQTYTIIGIEFEASQSSLVLLQQQQHQKLNEMMKEAKLYLVDHNNNSKDDDSSSALKWMAPSELLVPFLNLDEDEDEDEYEDDDDSLPAACVMIFPVVTGVSL